MLSLSCFHLDHIKQVVIDRAAIKTLRSDFTWRSLCKQFYGFIYEKLTSLRPSRRPRDLDCRSGKKAFSASIREVRSGSALPAAVRSAQERRALRRLSNSCLAVRERRCTGAASSSGSLHTSLAACTVCRRRDTGGDVSRDTSDSNMATLVTRCGTPTTSHEWRSIHPHINPYCAVARFIPYDGTPTSKH